MGLKLNIVRSRYIAKRKVLTAVALASHRGLYPAHLHTLISAIHTRNKQSSLQALNTSGMDDSERQL
jgi:hypothetical protein